MEFVRAAEQYEVTNDKLKVGSNKTERARQLLDLFDNKNSM